MKKKYFLSGEIELEIQTDSKVISVQSGDRSFSFPLQSTKLNKLSLNGNPDQYAFLLNGTDMVAQKGNWISIFSDKDAPLMKFKFDKAKFASLRWQVKSIATSDKQERTPDKPDAEKGPSNTIDAIRNSVVQLRISDASGRFIGSGTAFMVNKEGDAVTNFHVVYGASSATAVKDGSDGATIQYPTALIAVDPGLDLALIRIKLPDGQKELIPAKIASKEPTAGSDVWAIGYPLGLGFTVTKGIVNGIREFKVLPDSIRLASKYSSDSRWVQTDCTINAGNSGGPLVNSTGEVVGVNTWVWLKGSNLFFSLSASHLKEFVLKGQGITDTVKFSSIPEKFPKQAPVGHLPQIEIKPTLNPSDYIRQVLAFERAVKCIGCNSTGKVKEKKVTGYKGDMIKVPIIVEVVRACTRCKGSGISPPEVVGRALCGITEVTSTMRTDGAQFVQATEFLRTKIKELYPKYLRKYKIAATSQLFENSRAVQPKSALVVTGRMYQVSGSSGRFRVITLERDRLVIITDPVAGDEILDGVVMAGGIYAGTFEASESLKIPVLQGGFIVNIGTRE